MILIYILSLSFDGLNQMQSILKKDRREQNDPTMEIFFDNLMSNYRKYMVTEYCSENPDSRSSESTPLLSDHTWVEKQWTDDSGRGVIYGIVNNYIFKSMAGKKKEKKKVENILLSCKSGTPSSESILVKFV